MLLPCFKINLVVLAKNYDFVDIGTVYYWPNYRNVCDYNAQLFAIM